MRRRRQWFHHRSSQHAPYVGTPQVGDNRTQTQANTVASLSDALVALPVLTTKTRGPEVVPIRQGWETV